MNLLTIDTVYWLRKSRQVQSCKPVSQVEQFFLVKLCKTHLGINSDKKKIECDKKSDLQLVFDQVFYPFFSITY